MPIEVKDVSWSETEQFIIANVPLKGTVAKNVDIFSTNHYIKVSYPPYFFELALINEVDDESSKATVSNEQVTFHLKKKVSGIWGQLYSNEQKDKLFMKDIRAKALEYRQEKDQEKEKTRRKTKGKEKKFTVREQMRIDNVQLEKIKDLKNAEAESITKDMENWKDENVEDVEEEIKEEKCVNSTIINHNNNVSNPIIISKEDKGKKKSIPQPRSGGSIQVSFTPRVLATPARESKLPEEERWLSKVAEFNRMKNTDNTDATDIEEMNPMWLKDKGDDFFKKGNLVAAINAYSSALMLDSTIPMIYANRGACHLRLKQYNECIQDCNCALQLYEPPVPANLSSRCCALTRRGEAYFEQENYIDSLRDYEDAIKLDPKSDTLINEATRIRKIIQGDV